MGRGRAQRISRPLSHAHENGHLIAKLSKKNPNIFIPSLLSTDTGIYCIIKKNSNRQLVTVGLPESKSSPRCSLQPGCPAKLVDWSHFYF